MDINGKGFGFLSLPWQLLRGATVLGTCFYAGTALAREGNEVDVKTASIARRSLQAPQLQGVVPQQSTVPGNAFSFSFSPLDFFSDPEGGPLAVKVQGADGVALPNWISIDDTADQVTDFQLDDSPYPYSLHAIGQNLFTVERNYLSYDFSIFDFHNSENLLLLGSFTGVDDAEKLFVNENRAYIPTKSKEIQVLDFSNPASINLIETITTSEEGLDIQVIDDTIFLAAGGAGLEMIDISGAPAQTISTFVTAGNATSLEVRDDFAFVSCLGSGLQVINVQDPSAPILVGSWEGPCDALDVKLLGGLAFIACQLDGLKIIDVSDPGNPQFVGGASFPQFSVESARVAGNFAYVRDLNWNGFVDAALHTVDVSNASSPVWKGAIDTFIIEDYDDGYAIPLETITMLEIVGSYAVFTADEMGGSKIGVELSGNPTASDIGNYRLELLATDQDQLQATSLFTVRVEGPPVVNNPFLSQLVNVGEQFSYFLDQDAFSDPNEDVIFYNLASDGVDPLPTWLQFSSIGILSGLPPSVDVGNHTFSIIAHDAFSAGTAKSTFSLIVDHFPETVLSIPDQVLNIDVPFQFYLPSGLFFDADSGDLLTYSAFGTGGSLPSWVDFNSTDLSFSGVTQSSNAGTSKISVLAHDSVGGEAQAEFNLIVEHFPELVNPIASKLAAIDYPFFYSIPPNSFADLDDPVLFYSATTESGNPLPNWLFFKEGQRQFLGTPLISDRGPLSIKVRVEDSKMAYAEAFFNLTVTDFLGQENLQIGSPFSFAVSFGSLFTPAGSVSYSALREDGTPLPSWMNLNPISGVFDGTPVTDDALSLIVTADDGIQNPVNGALFIQVEENDPPQVQNPIATQFAKILQEFRFVVPADTFLDPNGTPLTLAARRVDERPLPSWLSFETDGNVFIGNPGRSDTGDFSDKTYHLKVCADDGQEEICTPLDLTVQGTSNLELALSIAGPLGSGAVLMYGWYTKRGVILNRFYKNSFTRDSITVDYGEKLNIGVNTEKEKIVEIRSYRGKESLIPLPKCMQQAKCATFWQVDKQLPKSQRTPYWLTYNDEKNLLTSETGCQIGDEGVYTIDLMGQGEIILERIRLVAGNIDEAGEMQLL